MCRVMINDKVYCIGHKQRKLYKLNSEPEASCCFGSTDVKDNSLSMWHLRFGHLGYDNLKLLDNKSLVVGLLLDQNKAFDRQCEGCAFGKQHRNPFPKKSEHESSQLLELIHTDVCRPMPIDSVGGYRYFATFIDDYSNYTTVYIIKHKSEMLQKFKEYVDMAENFTGLVRSDNAQEYVSESFKNYCNSRGIMRDDTVPYTPQQNGVAERMNRTIMETVRCMIHNAELALSFWAEAVATAVYVRNRSPTA